MESVALFGALSAEAPTRTFSLDLHLRLRKRKRGLTLHSTRRRIIPVSVPAHK